MRRCPSRRSPKSFAAQPMTTSGERICRHHSPQVNLLSSSFHISIAGAGNGGGSGIEVNCGWVAGAAG